MTHQVVVFIEYLVQLELSIRQQCYPFLRNIFRGNAKAFIVGIQARLGNVNVRSMTASPSLSVGLQAIRYQTASFAFSRRRRRSFPRIAEGHVLGIH